MTSVSKNVYLDKLDEIVNKYKKIYQFHGHMLLMILMLKKLLEDFIKKNYKKQIKKDLE